MMTTTQRDALWTIRATLVNWRRKFYAELAKDLPAGAVPSDWQSVITLRQVHHLRRSTLDALVRRGWLEERSGHGFGPEVRLVGPSRDARSAARDRGHAAGWAERPLEDNPHGDCWVADGWDEYELHHEWRRGWEAGVRAVFGLAGATIGEGA